MIKCPIELDNLNQLSFANATTQHSYFNGLPKLSLEGATFQRKDGTIRWPGSMEDILEYNYCMYRNKSHGNKWFYAFIDNIRYVNDNTSDIKISTDCYQTWQFDISWHASYVEREHVLDDSVGAHTIPEGLDTGEYVCNGIDRIYYAKRSYWEGGITPPVGSGAVMVCIQLTTLTLTKDGVTTEPSNPPTRSIINGVPQGTYMIGVPYTKDAMAYIYTLTGAYDGAGRSDAIVSMFLCPHDVCSWTALAGTGIWNGGHFYKADDSDNATASAITTISIPTSLDGYVPKNNKCFVAPYNYFHITNNAGSDIEYYYEDFISTPSFFMESSMEQGGSVVFKPSNSKKSTKTAGGVVSDGYSEGVMGAKLPQLSWQSDYYLNWEAQNGKNVAIQTGLAAAGFALNTIAGFTGPAMQNASMRETAVQRGYMPDEEPGPTVNAGGMLGGVLNFASQVASTQNAIRQAKMVPPQAKGNISGGYLQFAADECCFSVFKMSCRAEYIQCIDQYFSMFGYKVNSLKLPNISGRSNWNYVKTMGCNITGDIPQGDLQVIKGLFDRGITIWHNPSTFLDYSQNNNIV